MLSRATHRLFFAIPPDAAALACARAVAHEVSIAHHLTGPLVPAERLHLTVVYLGGFAGRPDAAITAAQAAASTLRLQPFDVRFDRVASFPGRGARRPCVMQAGDGLPALQRLRADLVAALAAQGMADPEAARPFVPHLTLRYDPVQVPATPAGPVEWRAGALALYVSHAGQGRHERVGDWAFAPH